MAAVRPEIRASIGRPVAARVAPEFWFAGLIVKTRFALLLVSNRLILKTRFALLAFRCLAAPERFRDERIAEHDLGLGHVFDGQQRFGALAWRRVIATNAGGRALRAEEEAAEPTPALDRNRHFD